MAKKLEKITAEAIKKLLKETGHSLTLNDFEAIYKLNEIGKRIANPQEVEAWDLLNAPVWAGKVKFYRPSLGVILWITDVASSWFKSKPILLDLAIAYACSGEYMESELFAIRDEKEAQRTIKKWWRGCKCSYVELERALKEILGVEDSDGELVESESISLDYGPVIAALMKEYGQPEHYWVWDVPLEELNALVSNLVQQREAQSHAEWRSMVKGCKGHPPPAPDWWMKKNADFLNLKNELRDKWQM